MQKKKCLTAAIAACAVALGISGCVPLQQSDQGTGPVTETELSDFGAQQIKWEDCGGAQCATVAAPLDWDNQDAGKAITLNLARLESHSDAPKGTIFVNPGGPGASGIEYVKLAGESLEPLLDSYHVVGWDPRGVGESSAVNCLTNAELDEQIFGNEADGAEQGTAEWLAETKRENEEYAAKCMERSGELIKHVSTADTVRDLDLLRQLVGDEQLNYLGLSYGTQIGSTYAARFPDKVGHLVLDGAIDPDVGIGEVVLTQTKGFELALSNYLTDCVARGCWYEGSVAEGLAHVGTLMDEVNTNPLQADDGRWVTTSVFYTAIATPLYAQENWPLLDRLFTEIAGGESEMALLLADFYHNRNSDGSYANNSSQAFNVINCADYPHREPDLEQMRAAAAELDQAAPVLGKYQGYSEASCWGWPVSGEVTDPALARAEGAAPILVIGTTGDPATPYEWAVALSEQLASGVLVTFAGEGHIAYGSSTCVTDLVVRYFADDQVPEPGAVCSV